MLTSYLLPSIIGFDTNMLLTMLTMIPRYQYTQVVPLLETYHQLYVDGERILLLNPLIFVFIAALIIHIAFLSLLFFAPKTKIYCICVLGTTVKIDKYDF